MWLTGDNYVRWVVHNKWIICWADDSLWEGLLGVCFETSPQVNSQVKSERCPKNWVVA